MPARSRTRKWSFDHRPKESFLLRMLYNQSLRSRRILVVLAILTILLSFNGYFSNSSSSLSVSSSLVGDKLSKSIEIRRIMQNRKIKEKIMEINDRQPSYKLYTYEGYDVTNARFRAQAKLLDKLKVHDKCQQNPGTIVVDVGASLGQFSFYAAACGCQVYMFEVDPIKIALIEKSIRINSFESRVHLITKAVSDLPSKSQITLSLNRSSQVVVDGQKNSPSSDTYTAESIRLSQLNFSSEIFFLRVDVEGYEIHVFRSAEDLFRKNLVRHVLFQYTPTGTDRIVQNDLLPYIKDILGGKRFFALHPREPRIFGPLYNEDIEQFYSQHHGIELERDVYVLFQDEDITLDAKPYDFQTSFE